MRPIVRFLLRYGIGYREFATICKAIFVDVATTEYGLRGRPTNLSRVAAMTGISRKEVSHLRSIARQLLSIPSMINSLNPPSVVLHFWHSDPDFADNDHAARPLRFSGPNSFSVLVRRYAGDIPAGAIRAELKRSGAIREESDGTLIALRQHHTPLDVDAGFIRSMAFSLANLANTLVLNAVEPVTVVDKNGADPGRFERYVWSSRLPAGRVSEFKLLASRKAEKLLAQLDRWIGEHETQGPGSNKIVQPSLITGLGIYYFETSLDSS